MPEESWVRMELEKFGEIIRGNPRQAALILRRILGTVNVHEVRLPGKKRGYAQLWLRFSGLRAMDEVLGDAPAKALLTPDGSEPDCGQPSRRCCVVW